jgi:hypothetical protein
VLGRRTLGTDVCITAKKDSGRIASRVFDLDKQYQTKKQGGPDGKAKDR